MATQNFSKQRAGKYESYTALAAGNFPGETDIRYVPLVDEVLVQLIVTHEYILLVNEKLLSDELYRNTVRTAIECLYPEVIADMGGANLDLTGLCILFYCRQALSGVVNINEDVPEAMRRQEIRGK